MSEPHNESDNDSDNAKKLDPSDTLDNEQTSNAAETDTVEQIAPNYNRVKSAAATAKKSAVIKKAILALLVIIVLGVRQRERSMQILIFSSLPIFFLSNYSWPADQLPAALQVVRWLVPTTPGINTSVQLNQMGASVAQVATGFYTLAGLWLFYFILLMLFRWRTQPKPQHKTIS